MAGGRPSKYSDEIAERIYVHLRYGATIEHAAQAEGVGSTTIYRWMEAHPPFRDGVERARGHFITQNLKSLNVLAARGNAAAAIWLLERRGGDEYREPAKKHEHDVAGELKVHVVYDSIPRHNDPSA